MKIQAIKFILSVLPVFLFLPACSSGSLADYELDIALQSAKKNRSELEKVLRHYRHDSLKLEAARFLIRNMPYHFTTEERFISPEGKIYDLNLAGFTNREAVKKCCDSLFLSGYRIRSKEIKDITRLDSQYLIRNIDLAFEAWKQPWAKNIAFRDFCEYILPYRAQTESPSSLREEMMERYLPVIRASGATNSLEACMAVNEQLKKEFAYGKTGSPLYPTIEETWQTGKSQCEGLCNLTAFIMRANGIPTAVDFTLWSKMDLGHRWCAVLHDGRFYGFGPAEESPQAYAVKLTTGTRIPPKVYRMTFSPRPSKWGLPSDEYRSYIKNPLFHDVTAQYLVKTVTIRVETDKKSEKDKSLVYLCAFNRDEWKIIAAGKRENEVCIFREVVGDNIFLIADSPDGHALRPVTAPFYVDTAGHTKKFIPDSSRFVAYRLPKRPKRLYQPYTLSYWDPETATFVSLPYAETADSSQTYDRIPYNALLYFTIPERILNQRIFFIENNRIRKY